MMRVGFLVAVALLSGWGLSLTEATGQCRVRSRPTVHAAYHAPVVAHHGHGHHYHGHYDVVAVKEFKDVVLVPYVQKVVVNPDYYYSVRDYYKDSIQLELLQMYRDMARARAGAAAGPAVLTPQVPLPAGVSAQLAETISTHCLRCHGGEQGIKGGVSLANLYTVSQTTWRACLEAVNAGTMPKGSTLTPQEKALFAGPVTPVAPAPPRGVDPLNPGPLPGAGAPAVQAPGKLPDALAVAQARCAVCHQQGKKTDGSFALVDARGQRLALDARGFREVARRINNAACPPAGNTANVPALSDAEAAVLIDDLASYPVKK